MELFGRSRELDELVDRLEGHRLVTVVGPGGIGKSSLARSAAARLAGRFALGAREVDLTRAPTPDAVGGAMAAQLGFASFSSLTSSSSDQPVLLVVDNCEHVIDAAARAITDLLDACASPTVIATSRAPLDLPGESLVVLGPLEVPRPGMVDVSAPALALLLERARDAGAAIAPGQLEAAAELTRRLDGVPLAIEIAAARLRSLTPAEVLARLGDLDTLSRPRFRGTARHRSLRATIEWSYQLLDERERDLFDRLGVCAGPFTAATAQALVAGPGTSAADALDALDGLVAASLLVPSRDGGTTRHRQLEAVRAFALERLRATGELEATWDRYVDHVLAQAAEVARQGTSGWNASIQSNLGDLYDDLAAALRWCVADDERPGRAMLLLGVLWGVVQQAHADDVAVLGEQVLERWPDRAIPGWGDAAASVANCRFLAGDLDGAEALAATALEVEGGSRAAAVTLRRVLGQVSCSRGDTAAAAELFAAAAVQARARGAHGMALEVDTFRAAVLADAGSAEEALDLVRAAARAADELGSGLNAVWARAVEGHILLRVDAEAALEVVAAALEEARAARYPAGVAANLRSLVIGELLLGRQGPAVQASAELLDEIAVNGPSIELRMVLLTAAAVLHRAGLPSWRAVAAAGRDLPAVSVLSRAGEEVLGLPDPGEAGAAGLPPGEALRLARHELQRLAQPSGDPAPGPSPGALAGPAPGPVTDAAGGTATGPAPGPVTETVTGTTGAPVSGPGAGRAPAPVAGEGEGPGAEAVFRLVGELWEVRFAGRSALVTSSKGMADLARLLAAPEREVHCLELVGGAVEEPSTGEVIDETARRRYEERVRELQADVDEAEAAHDRVRAERARAELDELVDHLAAVLGLSGRARRAGSSAERARSAVTQRVRATIRRIGRAHPELGRHLAASVVTGTFCCYRPEHPTRWLT